MLRPAVGRFMTIDSQRRVQLHAAVRSDNGHMIDAIIVDFSKTFDLVPHGRLLTKIANSGVDCGLDVWIREFLLGRTQRVRVGGK
jgi:hypothetical protein